MHLDIKQQRFFEQFGFLQFPGLLADRIEAIIADFEQVFAEHGGGHNGQAHDGSARSCIAQFIELNEGLSSLVDDPRLAGIATSLLGEAWNYIGSDGNLYTGDTPWHSDGWHVRGKYLKIALYLDEVGPDTGCLRVIPGSHQIDQYGERLFSGVTNPVGALGVEGRDIPCYPLESRPGDVVVFNHNLLHSAYGGTSRRRMFTLNLCDHADTDEKREELRAFINGAARFWLEEYFGAAMVRTASEERLGHLRQVLEHSDELPGLVARARATMSEPARG